MNRSTSFIFIVVLLLAGVIFACQPSGLFEKSDSFEGNSWNARQHLRYSVAVDDTLTGYNIWFLLRNTGAYPYSNIFFFVTTQSPEGTLLTDTLEYTLAAPDGKWLGKGWGSTWSHRLLYKQNIRFPIKGIYTFDIIHGMRDAELRGIPDAGLLVAPATKH